MKKRTFFVMLVLFLVICERLAQLHHAELVFASEQGKGTIVKLRFPQSGKEKNFTSS